jgi:uncharacterized small protein (TIGR04563 family)
MTTSQKKKVTLYFNSAMLAETQKEALRQDRSISWIIQAAWRIGREEVKRMPAGAGVSSAGVSSAAVLEASAARASQSSGLKLGG